jgi:hypothetical protein
MPANTVGRTFSVLPADWEKWRSLEFADYSEQLVAAFKKRGFVVVDADLVQPDYLVWIDFSMDASDMRKSIQRPWKGELEEEQRIGSGTDDSLEKLLHSGCINSGYFYSPPSFGMVGTEIHSGAGDFPFFKMAIVDRAASPEIPKIIYEGRVEGKRRRHYVTTIVPAMIRDIMDDFPGENGKTITDSGLGE